MNILITGGNGFLGNKLAQLLLTEGITTPDGKTHDVTTLTLVDVQEGPVKLADARVVTTIADISDPAKAKTLVTEDTDVIFHLAAIVSGQAEADFELGMQINMGGTQNLLEASRQLSSTPIIVYASSAAVYGGDVPDVLLDSTTPWPQSSYGAQKLIGEILVTDYSRKGFIDGRSLRLPTVVVRPGKPNAAASSFASSIIREPLNGESVNCPVGLDTPLWLTSPATVVHNIRHAASVNGADLKDTRSIPLPGITVTVADMLASLESIAGANVRGLVSNTAEPAIEKIVYTWPGVFQTDLALSLGFRKDTTFDSMVKQHMKG